MRNAGGRTKCSCIVAIAREWTLMLCPNSVREIIVNGGEIRGMKYLGIPERAPRSNGECGRMKLWSMSVPSSNILVEAVVFAFDHG